MPERTTSYLRRGPTEASLAYNVRLDVAAYQNLLAAKNKVPPQKFAEKLSVLNQLIRFNLQTSLGERYNVELFQTNYYIENGLIKHPLYQEPFIDIIRRGQKFRQEKGSTDIAREAAEVAGFAAMSRILLDSQAESLSKRKVIIISPSGNKNSIYQHNFFDVYQRGKDGQIVMSRFTCKFSYKEFYQTAVTVDPFANLSANPNDADFLSSPLITYRSIEEIQKIFSPQENTMIQEEYRKLLEACSPLITSYINAPSTQIYDALLNFSDDYVLRPHLRQNLMNLVDQSARLSQVIRDFGDRPVRQVSTACGLSQGSSLFRPFSVAEFGLNNNKSLGEKTLNCQCPFCNRQVEAIIACGKIICPSCGQSASYEC